ncbi:MAG: NUDIX pyrophosphatase [bacterium]
MREPFQILVIPFRHTADGVEFAVLKRSDDGYWQFIAGGGEDGESPIQSAERETTEEIGAAAEMLIKLDSISSVPINCFSCADSWSKDLYVIPEYCFGINVGDSAIVISNEHTEMCWLHYEQVYNLLKWDSNRVALWELNERLKKGILLFK